MNNNITTILFKSIKNNHEPGRIFARGVCFCKKCNTILTYYDNKFGYSGLYFTECKEK